MKTIFIYIIIIHSLLAADSILFSETENYITANTEKTDNNITIDWQEGRIYSSQHVEIKQDVNYAKSRILSIEKAKKKIKESYLLFLSKLNYDSKNKVIDVITADTNLNNKIYAWIDYAKLIKIDYPDLYSFIIVFKINLTGSDSLVDVFLRQTDVEQEININYSFFFKAEYTGLVIDARGLLETSGNKREKLQPALFFRILDQDGNVLYDRYRVKRNEILKKGLVLYISDVNQNIVDRVGSNPLYTTCYRIYGKNKTDPIISNKDASLMTSSQNSLEALKNGNVVIILDEDVLNL